jgi:hypothetical protein
VDYFTSLEKFGLCYLTYKKWNEGS